MHLRDVAQAPGASTTTRRWAYVQSVRKQTARHTVRGWNTRCHVCLSVKLCDEDDIYNKLAWSFVTLRVQSIKQTHRVWYPTRTSLRNIQLGRRFECPNDHCISSVVRTDGGNWNDGNTNRWRLWCGNQFCHSLTHSVSTARAVESVHKSSDSDSSIFKTPTPTPS
jgi:hypothetical protein